jgi:hypothetical protein
MTMYQIRIEHQDAIRWYQAESLVDAMELFDLLSKSCRFVQVWDANKMISEYKLWGSREMEIEYEYHVEANQP